MSVLFTLPWSYRQRVDYFCLRVSSLSSVPGISCAPFTRPSSVSLFFLSSTFYAWRGAFSPRSSSVFRVVLPRSRTVAFSQDLNSQVTVGGEEECCHRAAKLLLFGTITFAIFSGSFRPPITRFCIFIFSQEPNPRQKIKVMKRHYKTTKS